MDDNKLCELWQDPSVSIREIRDEMGLDMPSFRAAVRRLRLPRREFSDDYPLSPAQMRAWDRRINERKLEVQAKWTPAEEWQRRVQKCAQHYEFPSASSY